MKDIQNINAKANNSSGVRADFKYGNMLDQKRYIFSLAYVKDKEVLDCASGIGWGSFLMASAGAKSVIGVELSEHAINSALKYYSKENLNYLNSPLDKSGLPKASFDTIISFETLEHVQDPNAFLENLRALARPNAIMLLSTPNGYAFKHPGDRPYNPYHINEFDKESLLDMIRSSGWKLIEYRGQYPMIKGSEEIVSYRNFIQNYWRSARIPMPLRLFSKGAQAVIRRLSAEGGDPAFKCSCDPVVIDQGCESAYHFCILSAS
jgi:2-polyprenyl-3-methyl-5-hydroxy-6-metoxy-1,4-benzoquinol methylase